jgi:hypothetical protein
MSESTAAAPAESQSGYSFPLQDGEQVLQVNRRHWIYLWPNILLMLILAIVPLAGIWFVLDAAGAYEGVGALVFRVAAGIYAIYWTVRLFLTWYRYHNDVWVITNQRLVDILKSHPFSLKVSTADLVNVEDMTVDRHGFFRTVLDYGDINCQTAADNVDFLLRGIPHPREVQALVDRERDRERLRFRSSV